MTQLNGAATAAVDIRIDPASKTRRQSVSRRRENGKVVISVAEPVPAKAKDGPVLNGKWGRPPERYQPHRKPAMPKKFVIKPLPEWATAAAKVNHNDLMAALELAARRADR
jgi:hypothetical protein